MRLLLSISVLVLASFHPAVAAPAADAEIHVITWPTRHAAGPPVLTASAQSSLPAFRAALELLPESLIVKMALSQPAALGLTDSSAARLQPLLAQEYKEIDADPVFTSAPSSLSYCFAADRPAKGRGTLFRPAGSSAETPVILFLHGHGGSFTWYQHYLAKLFPQCIILCPAYGIDPSNIGAEYVIEALKAAEQKLGHPLRDPFLTGLSAGAFGAARLFAADPRPFRALVLLAGYAPPDVLPHFAKARPVHLLAGAEEAFVKDKSWMECVRELNRRKVPVRWDLIDGADHFFLLTHPRESEQWLREALATEAGAGRARKSQTAAGQ